MSKVFYMVKGPGPCSKEHATLHDAETEAMRLAAQHPGALFSILTASHAFVLPVSPVQRVWLSQSEPKLDPRGGF